MYFETFSELRSLRERENFQNSQIEKKKSERSSMIKIEINKWKIEDFFMREIDRRGVHLGRRDGDERPSWEYPWGHACRGSEPSPSVLLSELRTLLLMSSSFLSLSLSLSLSAALWFRLWVTNLSNPQSERRRFAAFFC